MATDGDESPLDFLNRLLEEEKRGNKHFGDVRFWKHIEHIDPQQVYRTTSLEFRNLKLMFYESFFYALYLLFLTILILDIRSDSLYKINSQQLHYWTGCDDGSACSINNVVDANSLMMWLRDDFTPLAFVEAQYYPSVAMSTSVFRLDPGTMQWLPRYVGDTQASVVLGVIRIRQLRTQRNKGCTILASLSSVQSNCYGPYTELYQSKLSWAPAWTPGYLLDQYTWRDANLTLQRKMDGTHGTYPGSGFILDLPLNLTGAQTRLTELNNWAWLDDRTRAVVIEINTYNANLNLFVNTRMLLSFRLLEGSS